LITEFNHAFVAQLVRGFLLPSLFQGNWVVFYKISSLNLYLSAAFVYLRCLYRPMLFIHSFIRLL